ncbi:MAG: acyl-CoA dehydrogenase [Proteobacteria bacterium]|nr:acyl-CoA dehydrogenase [Pseudomonadota bacterium]
MSSYNAPIRDMKFLFHDLGLLKAVQDLPGCEDASADMVDAILEESGKLAGNILAPLNTVGDAQGAVLENGMVRTAEGFSEAYRTFIDGGWNSLPFDPANGGQGLPWLVGMAAEEMWFSANTAWALCPLLTWGAVDLLEAHASPDQKARYLTKITSGEWTGTMNLTEPQAGSDVGALRCQATPEGDHYRIRGQKIFISWGEHDMTDNIVHLVLARTPDAPPGTKGISLFIVPKFIVNDDGTLGARNDLRVVSLEHKLGIKASPTCVMSYGDSEGAIGYLVGTENRGLNCMFTMMNNARINVGLSGLAIAERAYQQATAFARERVQGSAPDGSPQTIICYPDVRRMLLTMKASTEAMRAVTLDTVACLDRSRRASDPADRARAQTRLELMTPVVKAWCTDLGVEVASLGVQVHGGMGYMEETGAVQHLRDARIAPIYEGTNGIQAIDLLTRKVLRDGGDAVRAYIGEIDTLLALLDAEPDPAFKAICSQLARALQALGTATDWLLEQGRDGADRALAGATPYLRLFGTVAGGVMMARSALAAQAALEGGAGDTDFLKGKMVTARFYAENILPQAEALVTPICDGHSAVLALPEDQF